MKNQIFMLIIFGLTANIIFAQKGELLGKVLDKEYNDILPFANVLVKNSSFGTTTDFEGNYSLKLKEGNYTVVFSFIGYETIEINDVVIKSNEVVELNASIGPLENKLEEVIVKASTKQNTESSLLNVQKRSINLLDAISAQTFSKIGASNSAAAVKSVPGVSVQGGKYVYVRGLGDRYTKSILNGVDIPGLDPDRNTIQMDIFPTNILDNIQVVKSFTANYPADFTGGVVNIVTKDFSNKAEYSVSVGVEYNPKMHFNSNYLTSSSSKTDLFGFDNGKRNMPIGRDTKIPSPSDNNPALSYLTAVFDPEMKAKKEMSFMNTNFGLTASNQYDVGNNKIGYLASFSYRNDVEFYENYETGNYLKSQNSSENELQTNKHQVGDLGHNSVLFSGLAGLTFKTNKSKFNLTGLHIQNGISTAGYFKQEVVFDDAVTLFKDNIEYKQSQLTNILISGKHSNEDGSWNIEWKLSPTFSKIEDKDVRVAPFQYEEGEDNPYTISPSSAGSPSRIWRALEEVNAVAKLDLTHRHNLFNKKARLLFGGNYTYKQRDFGIDLYNFGVQNSDGANFNGDADAILDPKNIWNINTKKGTYLIGNYQPTNTYDSNQSIIAGYISEEFQITDKLKSIIGLRFEKFDLIYSGQNNQGDIVYDEVKVLDKADFFPSVNLIYGLNDETNIRGSYGRTTARPSFKEASIAQIYDPISTITFNGNIDIQPTYVDNFDIRYERFGEKAQMFAISAFFKNFTDPIEMTYFLSSPSNIEPNNLGSAMVYGLEFEWRKNFGFITEKLEDLSVNINFSIINSELEMGADELEARSLSLRDGEKLEDTRELQGQSPYLINFGLNYASDNGWQTNLYYNVQGKTLEVVGSGAVPDAYTMPFHSLDLIINKSFGK
ncbi:MAG: TonB-dependent receptor plug domain-containing protein, partial [Flavobacteriaceae bacterium]|nr:TonB-dependent receptor plug domain-containing protein [Flavobacteriaceae bacterium]